MYIVEFFYNFSAAIDKKQRAPFSENSQSDGLACNCGRLKFQPQLHFNQFRTYSTVVYLQSTEKRGKSVCTPVRGTTNESQLVFDLL